MRPTYPGVVGLSELQISNYRLIEVMRSVAAEMHHIVVQSRIDIRKSRDAMRRADEMMAGVPWRMHGDATHAPEPTDGPVPRRVRGPF